MRFSERYGLKSVRTVIQIESIDEALRNGLWSLLQLHAWNDIDTDYIVENYPYANSLCQRLWLHYFKLPLDTLPLRWGEVLAFLRKYFFECAWYEVYDFVEFVGNSYDHPGFKERFPEDCNAFLERELSAYRLVNGVITRITDEVEVAEIENALNQARGPIRTHLHRALELLSDRKSPDYRNSIKESISAVESLVAKVVGEKGTLGQLLKKMENEIVLHSALGRAFSHLYGYTSDEDGIRHAILESERIGFEDAKFFLVVCSAFVNFVESKVEVAGPKK